MELLLFVDDMILYIENHKDATKIPLELISKFGKVSGYKINAQKYVVFLYINSVIAEGKIKKTIPFTVNIKNFKVPCF